MTAGVEIINASGTVMLGGGQKHFLCILKRTVTVPNNAAIDQGTYALTPSNTPIKYTIEGGGWFGAPKYVRWLEDPMIFIGKVSHNGNAAFHYRGGLTNTTNPVFGDIKVSAPGYANGTPISVTFYIFANRRPSPSSANFGLQVFDASGQLEFDSTYRLLQIVGIAPVNSDSWTSLVPAGKEYAMAIAGNQYWNIGGSVYCPGIKNDGTRLGIATHYVTSGFNVDSKSRPTAMLVIAEVTGAT